MHTFLALPKEKQIEIVRSYEAGQHLYFILSPEHKLVKIGVARNPFIRHRTLQSGSPTPLELIHVIPFGGFLMEKLLHEYFKDFRRKGEWFVYNKSIKQFIKYAKTTAEEEGIGWDLKTRQVTA